MKHPCLALAIGSALVAAGCANVNITAPADQSTVAMPSPVTVKQTGIVDYGVMTLDNVAITRQGGYPPSPLRFVAMGSHVLAITATDNKWHNNLGSSVTFNVSSCPLCYTCPASQVVNPITGQCCTNVATTCDSVMAFNFGPTAMGIAECQKALFPGSSETFADYDCVVPTSIDIGGTAANKAVAVSFSPTSSGALAQIQVPIGASGVAASATVWVTSDAAGAPGAVLETIAVNPVRAQPFPVVSPIHIFSNAHPTLTAGSRYWLVIGVPSTSGLVKWNKTALFDVSTTGMTTLRVSTTSSSAGPWSAASPVQEVRPAFEVDVR